MSKIKVDQIEGSTGSTITVPSGQTLTVTDGLAASTITSGTLADARLPTVPVSKGGTGLTSLGSAAQVLQVNSGGSALEFATASGGKVLGSAIAESFAKTTWSNPGEVNPGSGNMSDYFYPNSSACYHDLSYTKQSATSRLFVSGHQTIKTSSNTHDFAVFIVGDEANGRILHIDEHNFDRQYLAASFNVQFGGSAGSKTIRATAGTGNSRSHTGKRGILGSDMSLSDVSDNNGYTYLSVIEVEV